MLNIVDATRHACVMAAPSLRLPPHLGGALLRGWPDKQKHHRHCGTMVIAVPPTFVPHNPSRARDTSARHGPARWERAMPWAWITAPTPSTPTDRAHPRGAGRRSGRDSRVHSTAAAGAGLALPPARSRLASRSTTPDRRHSSTLAIEATRAPLDMSTKPAPSGSDNLRGPRDPARRRRGCQPAHHTARHRSRSVSDRSHASSRKA
jgi:hypothetical protein